MRLMATSSSSDAASRGPAGLRTLLTNQWIKCGHPSILVAPSTSSEASSQRDKDRHRGCKASDTAFAATSGPYEPFPTNRYSYLRAYESPMHSRALQRQHAVVAMDLQEGQQVLLTSFNKASVTEWQLKHVERVMQTLHREPGTFQRLLQVWDAGNCWVVVQEMRAQWTQLRGHFMDPAKFTEEKMRKVVFQVTALVHFLHRHQLSLAGELVHCDLMMTNDQVVLLLHLDLILSGCILVSSTEKNRASDVAALGMLMFQIAMMPRSPKHEVDIRYLEGSIEDQLAHLSSACRDVLLDCLTTRLTAQELLSRKWLRQVDFIASAHKLDGSSSNKESRAVLQKSLLWKLAAVIMMKWLQRPLPTQETQRTEEEEETESTRQCNRRPSRRVFTRSRLYVPNGVLRRGPLPVPVPAGHLLLAQNDNDDMAGNNLHLDQRRHIYSLPRELEAEQDADGKVWNVYDDFGYDFPNMYSSPKAVLYDDFDFDEDQFKSGDEDDYISLPNEERRSSISNFTASDGVRELQREVVRSLQHDETRPHKISGNQLGVRSLRSMESIFENGDGDYGHKQSTSRDAVHFSAFGPAHVALCETFRIDIWAYLKQQREMMLETALEHNDAECGHRTQPLQIERGTLVTVSLETSVHFEVAGEDCKSFRWRGDITGVSFDVFRNPAQLQVDEEDDELFIARIVAGTRVSVLYIRLQASSSAAATKPSDLTLLDARMEHVASNLRDIPGEELDIIRPIGHGAFGDAMLARWKSTAQDVVVKMMNQDAYRSSDALAEFRHEAEVMNLLGKHPHVVELFGVSSSTGSSTGSQQLSLVTEYLPNGSLEDVLGMNDHVEAPVDFDADPSISLFSRTIMARDAAHGLANIHQGHFLHRDIAARNCLVDAQFRVKVCDFGLSRRLSSSSSVGFLFDDTHHGFGPLKWMAPESITPPHLFSTYSDSYMFGVLLYEIFSGHAPFPKLSSRDAAALILEGHHVPIPSSLPTAHRQLMQQCFNIHPLRRPSMDEIYNTLDRWVLQDTRDHIAIS